MLKEAKQKFEKDVEDILIKAMSEAFKGTSSKCGDSLIDDYMEDSINKIANKFANKVAECAAKPLTDAIDEYIKASGLFINVSPAGIALSGPTGPVTGTITINPSTSKIEIM
jgi:hypothetical protein